MLSLKFLFLGIHASQFHQKYMRFHWQNCRCQKKNVFDKTWKDEMSTIINNCRRVHFDPVESSLRWWCYNFWRHLWFMSCFAWRYFGGDILKKMTKRSSLPNVGHHHLSLNEKWKSLFLLKHTVAVIKKILCWI